MARREFVVSDQAQIYPEYALVYERLKGRKDGAESEQRSIPSDRLEGQRRLAAADGPHGHHSQHPWPSNPAGLLTYNQEGSEEGPAIYLARLKRVQSLVNEIKDIARHLLNCLLLARDSNDSNKVLKQPEPVQAPGKSLASGNLEGFCAEVQGNACCIQPQMARFVQDFTS